jgi:hypothetical protein
MLCPECNSTLNVESIQEVTNSMTRVNKRKLYRCINPNCKMLPYFYRDMTIEVHVSDLKFAPS